jgi:hypothetical protein
VITAHISQVTANGRWWGCPDSGPGYPLRRVGAGVPSSSRRAAFHAVARAVCTAFEVEPSSLTATPQPLGSSLTPPSKSGAGLEGRPQPRSHRDRIRPPADDVKRGDDVILAEQTDRRRMSVVGRAEAEHVREEEYAIGSANLGFGAVEVVHGGLAMCDATRQQRLTENHRRFSISGEGDALEQPRPAKRQHRIGQVFQHGTGLGAQVHQLGSEVLFWRAAKTLVAACVVMCAAAPGAQSMSTR